MEEEFEAQERAQGLFSSPDKEGLTAVLLELIGKKLSSIGPKKLEDGYEYVDLDKYFTIDILLKEPLNEDEEKELNCILDRFKYVNCCRFSSKELELWIMPKYPIESRERVRRLWIRKI